MKVKDNTKTQPINELAMLRHRISELERSDIDHKREEEALKTSEQRLKTLFERHHAVMLLIEPDSGKIVYANHAASKFYGYTEGQLSSMNITDINQLEPSDIAQKLKRAKKEEGNYFIFPHRLASGEVRTVEVHSTPIDVQGKLLLFSIIHDITERKKAEKALLESEEKYRNLVEYTTDWVWEMDSEGKFVYTNNKILDFLGYTSEEIMGKTPFEFAIPEHAERSLQVFQEKKPFQHLHDTHRHRDGRLVTLDTSGVPVFDDQDIFIGYRGVTRDITELKQAGEALRKSEERFRELAELLPETVFETDIKGVLTFGNKKAFDSFGYAPEDFANGLNVFDVVTTDDRGRALKNMQRVMNGENIGSNEYTLRKKDGSVFPSIIHSTAIVHDGKPVGFRGFVIDMTERKQMEETLMESEERLRLLSDNLPSGMVYQLDFGEDGSSRTFTYVSAGVEQLHGITAAEVKKDAAAIYNQVYEDDRPLLAARETEAMIAMSIFSTEHRVRQPSGEIRWHLVASSPRRLTNNHLVWDGIEIDITGRKRAEEEREKLILELREALKKVKLLSGLLPVCASCKKIRNDKGYWEQIEVYIRDHSEANFSHGICPDCAKRLYPGIYKKK